MNLETLDQLPDGKTELPATITVNKLGTSVNMKFSIDLKLKGRDDGQLSILRRETTDSKTTL